MFKAAKLGTPNLEQAGCKQGQIHLGCQTLLTVFIPQSYLHNLQSGLARGKIREDLPLRKHPKPKPLGSSHDLPQCWGHLTTAACSSPCHTSTPLTIQQHAAAENFCLEIRAATPRIITHHKQRPSKATVMKSSSTDLISGLPSQS